MRLLGKLTMCVWIATFATATSAERLYVNDKKVPESREDLVRIRANLLLERASQKQIVIGRGGVNRTLSSLPAARMLVSFFSLVGLTSMSPLRLFSPTIMPS